MEAIEKVILNHIKPFLEYKEKGIFVLVKTSNPSSSEFQNLFNVRLDDIANSQIEFKSESIILEFPM